MKGDTDILRELYMLTGKVDKDKNYLYYLLIKDGVAFNQGSEKRDPVIAEGSVSTFEEWFNEL